MDDIGNIVYVLAVIGYMLYRVFAGKKKPQQGESSPRKGSTIEDIHTEKPDDIIFREQLQGSILKAMTRLTEREQTVIRLRFGISDPDPVANETYNLSAKQLKYLGES